MAIGTILMEHPTAPLTQTAPASATPADPARQATWRCLGAALLSGALLWACYHPLALGSVLGWIALAPLLVLVRSQARPRWIFICAWLGGSAFFWPVLHWMTVADYRMYATWAMLAFYCSLYFPAAIWMLRRLERWRLPLVFTVPLVWAALEYVRCFLMTGFAWYLLAHTQHDVLPMIQITDLGGVFLVSALVALVNAFIFECLACLPALRRWLNQSETPRRNLVVQGAIVALLVAATYGYGAYRLGSSDFRAGPTVALLQSNLDQRLRLASSMPDNDGHSLTVVAREFSALCNGAAFNSGPHKPDLLIWPETSYMFDWVEVAPKLPVEKVPTPWREAEADMRDNLHHLSTQFKHIPQLIGITTRYLNEQGKPCRYNSALLVNANGRVEDRFDKMHRVPFGEYVPLKDWLPFMNRIAPYDFDYSIRQGEKFTRFLVNDRFRFGVLICNEDSDPFLARQYVNPSEDGPAVDFLVNISNDGWFDGSSEHEEHLVVSRFRAIECRRAMVRAVNMGISAVIDGNGRVLQPLPYLGTHPPTWFVPSEPERLASLPASAWHEFKKVGGVLRAAVPIDGRFSFYAWAGDWLPIGCWAFLFAACGVAIVRRRMANA